MPFVAGIGAVVLLWVIAGIVTGSWSPLKYVEGADGRPSTSKFQWLFWTAIVFFAYVAVYAAKAQYGYVDATATIPENVLYAITFSTATMAAAKGVTSAYAKRTPGLKVAPAAADPTKGIAGLVNDDTNQPDLSKLQMVGWTVLIGIIYVTRVVQVVYAYYSRNNDLTQLPDIDKALMVLMGISQGGYLGKKIATT